MNKLRIKQKRIVINLLREFFDDRGFFELETPLLVPSPGMEVHLHSFKTVYDQYDGSKTQYHLPTSPEFAIKKALGAGFGKVFEIARVFRNQGELGPQHHPEFNMLEWYRPGSYLDIMEDVECLLAHLGEMDIVNPVSDFSWSDGVNRISINECFMHYANIDLQDGMKNLDQWRVEAQDALHERIPDDDQFDDIFFRIWMKLIEPHLGKHRPEIVYDYPPSMAALSKLKQPDLQWAERFELYIQGVEIGNAFSELTDSQEQLKRFEMANRERQRIGYPPHPIDTELIDSVGKMQATGGIAMGIERLLMTLTGEQDIREFFLYPLGNIGETRRR